MYLQVVTSSVAFGMLVAYERTRGPKHWFYSALLENHGGPHLTPWQLVWMSIARIMLGKHKMSSLYICQAYL